MLLSISSGERNENGDHEPQTELDSHANMLVAGRHAYVLARSDWMVNIAPLTPDYKPRTVPLADVAIQYDNVKKLLKQ